MTKPAKCDEDTVKLQGGQRKQRKRKRKTNSATSKRKIRQLHSNILKEKN